MQISNEQLDQLDVRSLRILKYLLETRSISNTAEYIGLSQPATSRIVARLRRLLGDPLLVRADRGYAPTELATRIYPRLGIALESIQAVLEADEFDIGSAEATLRVASTDYGTVTVLRNLYRQLLKRAPGVNLEISNFTPAAFTQVEQGELDLALYANFNIPGDFHYRKLFEEDYSLLVRKGHRLLQLAEQGKTPGEDDLAKWPHAEIIYPTTNLMHNDSVIDSGTTRETSGVKVRMPYFLMIVGLIEDSDTIVALPTRMCRYAEARFAVQSIPLPDEGFTYVAIWHHRQHQRPLLRWVLDVLSNSD